MTAVHLSAHIGLFIITRQEPSGLGGARNNSH
jgi:hypothetical protein